MGGGANQEAAFRWLCNRSSGGDFLAIGAVDTDQYNSYVSGMCKQNSVATLVIPSREAAMDPFVASTIRKAEAVFIIGGDQARYVRNWKGTPVQDALNALIDRNVPIGGNSAGLAILGEFTFAALNDSAFSKETLANPYNDKVTITKDFLKLPHLQRTITDTHFVKRDRLGRLLGFMARIVNDKMSESVLAVAVDQDSVVLMDKSGKAAIAGEGKGAYFYRPAQPPEVCQRGTPLTYREISVYHAPTGATFDLAQWSGSGGNAFTLNVVNGVIHSTQPGNDIY